MADITLWLVCDRAVAASFGVVLGAGWARVIAQTPPASDWVAHLTPVLRAAKDMLTAVSINAAVTPTRVIIEGPDVPADPAALEDLISHTWSVVACGEAPLTPATAQTAVTGSVEGTPVTYAARAAAPPPKTAASTTLVPPQGSARRGGQRSRGDEGLVAEMVATLRAHATQYGSAPDFRAEKPVARERIYNYIRSTTARPQAPDSLVEAVRRRLADGQ